MRPDHVLQRPQHGQVRHPVRSRPHRHPATLHGRLHPRHHRRRVQLGRDPGRRPTGLPHPQPGDHRPKAPVDLGPVLQRQRRRRSHHRNPNTLGDLTGGQRGHRHRHLVHQRPRQPHEPVPQRRRLPPRQRHHRPHRPRHIPRRHHLPRTPQRIRRPRLHRRRRPLHPLQARDQVNPLPVTEGVGVHAGQPRRNESTTPTSESPVLGTAATAGTSPVPAGPPTAATAPGPSTSTASCVSSLPAPASGVEIAPAGALTASEQRPGTAEPGSTTRPSNAPSSMR